MAVTVELPVPAGREQADAGAKAASHPGQKPSIEFPDRCVYCLAPADTTTSVRLAFRRGRYEAETRVVWQAPYCSVHQRINRRITRLNKIAAGAASLVGAAGALFIARSVQAVYVVQTLVFLLTVIPCVLVCLLVWAVLRSLLARFSRSIRHTGITNAALGFRASYKKDVDRLRFTFVNVDYARSFAAANTGKAASPKNGTGPR